MKVAVVTPTIGNVKFRDCLNSVETQTYQDLTHYVFIDGMEYFPIVEKGATHLLAVKCLLNI